MRPRTRLAVTKACGRAGSGAGAFPIRGHGLPSDTGASAPGVKGSGRQKPLIRGFQWWFAAPLLLSVLGQLLQGSIASLASAIGGGAPVALQIGAVSVTSVPVDGYAGVVQALVALAGITAVVAGLAGARFAARDL